MADTDLDDIFLDALRRLPASDSATLRKLVLAAVREHTSEVPEDDEPVTADDLAAIEEARSAVARGDVMSDEAVMAELTL